jgi:glycosyltransferase involved in cell wall biosynthesis
MKFAFISPRYGAEISSGADHACRLLAEQVSARHDVDVLTTCAREPGAWKNDYGEGADRVRGALVRRFAVSHTSDWSGLAALSRRLHVDPPSRADELEWVRLQGPASPGLLDYLKRQHRSYDVLVFFGLMHPLAIQGMEIAPERTVIFPYLRLQSELRFGLWRDVLEAAHGIGYFSDSERRLIRAYVGLSPRHDEVVGIGIDPPPMQAYPRHQQDPADVIVDDDEVSGEGPAAAVDDYLAQRGVPFRRRHRLYGSFALYGGRVEPDNGCEEMLEYFDSYAASDPEAMLVLMGVKMMKLPDERYLKLAGVLPERERMIAYEAASVTIAPAADDLLAQPLLESLAVGTPVLASARNPAAVEHCRRANAGLCYANREEFVAELTQLATNPRLRERLGENGRAYIRQHHRWDGVVGRFERLISKVRTRQS